MKDNEKKIEKDINTETTDGENHAGVSSAEEQHPEDPAVKKDSKFKDILDALLFAAIVALILKTFIVEAYRIPTGSMENTLMVGDFLLVNKFTYGPSTPRNIPFTNIRLPFFSLPSISEPEKGDVIVFDYPGEIEEEHPQEIVNFIKRLVGEPGDTILVKNQVLFVNGKEFPKPGGIRMDEPPKSEKLIDPGIFPRGSGWNNDFYGPLVVPKKGDAVKVTRDNFEMWKMLIIREGHSIRITADNKIFIDEKESPEYKIEKNYYFAMGDHRTNSSDSRFWGFLPRENIVGEAMLVYWSWNPDIPFAEAGDLLKSIRWNRIAMIIR